MRKTDVTHLQSAFCNNFFSKCGKTEHYYRTCNILQTALDWALPAVSGINLVAVHLCLEGNQDFHQTKRSVQEDCIFLCKKGQI